MKRDGGWEKEKRCLLKPVLVLCMATAVLHGAAAVVEESERERERKRGEKVGGRPSARNR